MVTYAEHKTYFVLLGQLRQRKPDWVEHPV